MSRIPPGGHAPPDVVARANLTAFMRGLGPGRYRGVRGRNHAPESGHAQESYDALWRWSVDDRAGFWQAVVERLGIVFRTPAHTVLDASAGPEHARWFVGAELNIVESCFQQPAGAVAVVHRRGGALHRVTYGELERLVDGVAGSLRPAERVAIAMPMTLEAVVAYLAVVKAGAVVVSVADSFAPPEIATRLRIGGATRVITQDVVRRGGRTLPMGEKVWTAGAAETVVVRTPAGAALSLRPGDRSWTELLGSGPTEPAIGSPDRPTNILFSSGTTGEPKAVPWTHLTPVKAAMDGHFHQDVQAGDVVCWPTNLGWMMGPWLLYASLVNGAAMALFDDAPTGRAFGEFVRDAEVTMLGVVPSLMSTWRATGCMEGLDWSRVSRFSSTGEVSSEGDVRYLMALAGGRPVLEYCGGTEVGGGYVTSTRLHPAEPSTFTTPALGLDLAVLDDEGRPADEGEGFLVGPSVGLSTQLLNGDHHAVYYAGVPRPGLRRHGDRVRRLPGGRYRVLGRVDDVMNLGGIKVSSAELERVLRTVEGVEAVAAVAIPVDGGGPDRLVAFVTPTDGNPRDAERIRAAMQRALREWLNPLFRVSEVVLVDVLPRTASNKVMRRVLRQRLTAPGDA